MKALFGLFLSAKGGPAGPASVSDPAGYWPKECRKDAQCWSDKFQLIAGWEDSNVIKLKCDTANEHCICRKGYMDADNDPRTGCELKIDEDACYFGTCSDHGVSFGEACSPGWSDLVCGQDACCQIASTSTTSRASTTTTTVTTAGMLENSEANCLQTKLDAYCSNLGVDDDVELVGEHSNCNDSNFARFDGQKWRCYTSLKPVSESSGTSCISAAGDELIGCQDPDPEAGFCTRNQIILNLISTGCADQCLQKRLDNYCQSLTPDICAEATEGMVARYGLNQNGKNIGWRCYSATYSISVTGSCISADGSFTNDGCSDPVWDSAAFCAAQAPLSALVEQGCEFDKPTNVIEAGESCSNYSPIGNRESRIIGGVDAEGDVWNWMVKIVGTTTSNTNFICGGTIIDRHWVMTAASCCVGGESFVLHFGDEANSFEIEVDSSEDYFVHPSYTGFPNQGRAEFGTESTKNKNFAICMIRLPIAVDNALQKSGCVGCSASAACMPGAAPVHGSACWIAGWGATDREGKEVFPDQLQSAGVNVMSRTYCRQHNVEGSEIEQMRIDEFCAGSGDLDGDGFTDVGNSACFGDKGAPLVCNIDGRIELAGIYQWGPEDFNKCAKPGFPGVYTNVYNMRRWVAEVMADVTIPSSTTTTTTTTTTEFCPCPMFYECQGESCVFSPNSCPILPVEWKGQKQTAVMYKAPDGYSVRVNIPNDSASIDIRSNPYTGFIIISRRYCGAEFTTAILNNEVSFTLMDSDVSYQTKYMYERVDGGRSSVTIQFEQITIPDADFPSDNGDMDQFYVLLAGTRNISIKNVEKCFQWEVGFLPTDYTLLDEDLSGCAGVQKDIGF